MFSAPHNINEFTNYATYEPNYVLQLLYLPHLSHLYSWKCKWIQGIIEWRFSLACVDPLVNNVDIYYQFMHTCMLFLQPKLFLYTKIKTKLRNFLIKNQSYIAVHLRGTDKWKEAYNSTLITPEAFVPHIVNMMQQKQTCNIYIATDDSSYTKDMIEKHLLLYLKKHEIQLNCKVNIILPKSYTRTAHDTSLNTIDQINNKSNVGYTQYGIDTFCDLFALIEADGIIGTRYSTFSIVAILLAIGYHELDMYYYIDQPEFFHPWHPSIYI